MKNESFLYRFKVHCGTQTFNSVLSLVADEEEDGEEEEEGKEDEEVEEEEGEEVEEEEVDEGK